MGKEMPNKPEAEALEEAAEEPPFGAEFFAAAFRRRIGEICRERPGETIVVFLQLADGALLDLCHIRRLAPRWLMAAVFREGSDCREMDTALVPYEMISRLTFSSRKTSERRLGFQLEKSAAAVSGGG